MDVAIVGSCMIDYISYVPRLPKEGETIHSSNLEIGFGGKGANQCVCAAKLGAKTSLLARVGDDSLGLDYRKHLNNLNINIDNVLITNCKSGIAQINVSNDGANQIVIAAGANQLLSVNDVLNCKQTIESAKVLICQLETPIDVALQAIGICNGVTILNGAPAIENCNPNVFTLPAIFCVNESEAAIFTEMESIDSLPDAIIACGKLLRKGCKSVILTMGPQGVMWVTQEHPEPIYVKTPKVKCVDSTGAGDAFLGALATFIAQNQLEFKECIAAACIVASESVQKNGTQTSFPTEEILKKITQVEIEKLLS